MVNQKKDNKSIWITLREIATNKSVVFSILITLTLLLAFRLVTQMPIPGVKLPDDINTRGSSSFADMLNLLAGGGLTRMSLFAVGISPYITAQIMIQLLSSDLIPPLSRMAKSGERGKKKLEIITRFLMLPLCMAQSYAAIALILNNAEQSKITIFGYNKLEDLSLGLKFALMLTFTGGSYICIFISDIITKRGVGNGVTLIILSGIVGNIVPDFTYAFHFIGTKFNHDSNTYTINVALSYSLYISFFLIVLVATIFINDAIRKIPIQQTGQGIVFDAKELSYLPIKLIPAGVIPVIFASSIMTIPGTIAQFLNQDTARWVIEGYFTLNSWLGISLYWIFIVLFSFFYSYVQINPEQMSENFEKSNKFIPGVKNGLDTEKHITKVLNRANFIGAPYLATIAIFPYILSQITGIPTGLSLGGTGIIIIISGILELWNAIKSASTTSEYAKTKNKIKRFVSKTINEKQEEGKLW